jgi:hypothetical protein
VLEVFISMQRLLNPPGSAYRSETGGLMEALRVLAVDQSEALGLFSLLRDGISDILLSY